MTRARVARWAALAVGTAVLAAPMAAQAKVPRTYVGMLGIDVNAYRFDPAGWDASFAAMSRAHVGTFRQTFDAGRPTSTLDAFVATAARHHIRINPLVIDNSHYQLEPRATHGVYVPKRYGKLTRFSVGLASRYGPKGTFWTGSLRKYRKRYAMRTWQIWNEPNLPVWWRPRPNPKAYARMCKVVGKAIHRVDRHATIVSAGIPDSKQSKPRNYKRYLTAFLRAGGGKRVNAVAAHVYAPTVRGVQRILRTYRRILNAHHGRRLKLFISEIGWASGGHRNKMVVGEKGQARLIKKTFKRIGKLRRRYKISGLYYFDWKDYQPLSTDPRGDTWGYHTGLLRADGTRKPAFRAFRRAVAHLR